MDDASRPVDPDSRRARHAGDASARRSASRTDAEASAGAGVIATVEERVAEHVVGYRVWRLRRDGRLVSAGVGCTAWTTGVNVARCDARCERVPGGACGCGLYAFHDPPPAPAPGIVGAIRAHGALESHHDGFRAQYAEVVALVQRGRRSRRRERRAAGIYGVPLVQLQELACVAAEHGQPLAASLRPARERDEILDESPLAAAVHARLERGYARVAARLRRHPRVRSAALAALAYLPLVTLAGWGCLAALTARGDGPGAWAWWLSLLPAVLGTAALLARQAFGSRWLRPVRVWPLPSVLLLAVPLQFAGAAGVDGLAVEALTWTVAITAAGVVLSGFGRLADPLCLGATTAWVAGLPLVLALVPGQVLLVLGGAALAQFATVFPMHARRLLRGRSTR